MRCVKFIMPLAIYFLAEWIFGIWVALGVSIGLSLIGIIYELCKNKRLDYSSLFDILFISVFAVVDIIPYKWSFSFLLMGIVLLLMVVGILNISVIMKDAIPSGVRNNPYTMYKIKRSQFRMMIWLFVGAMLFFVSELHVDTVYTEWSDSWLLLTLFLGWLASELIFARVEYIKYRDVEWVPLVMTNGTTVGQCPRPLVHNGSLWLHPVVHLHVFSEKGLLLQLRPMSKKIQPGKWDTAVGGHIAAGESLETSLKREVWEEIGLSNFTAQLVSQYVWECPVEHEYVFSFKTLSSGPFVTKNEGEVDELRLWSFSEICDNIGKNVFTPNLERELTQWILPNKEALSVV